MTGAILALALAVATSVLAGEEPRVRKLDGEDAHPPEVFGEPGRPLPRTIAICHDRAAGRCWTVPREADCAPEGTIYRAVIDEPGDVREALAACREEPNR